MTCIECDMKLDDVELLFQTRGLCCPFCGEVLMDIDEFMSDTWGSFSDVNYVEDEDDSFYDHWEWVECEGEEE